MTESPTAVTCPGTAPPAGATGVGNVVAGATFVVGGADVLGGTGVVTLGEDVGGGTVVAVVPVTTGAVVVDEVAGAVCS
jgi:hypothetical protein